MATRSLLFLTSSQVSRLHARKVIVGAVPTQPAMLDSAVYAPINKRHYEQEQDVFRLAATLAERIMRNHAFQDGNKRTALLAADMFLKINGYSLQQVPLAEDAHNKGLADAHVAVITNQWTVEQLRNYYQSVAQSLTQLTEEITEYRNSATCL